MNLPQLLRKEINLLSEDSEFPIKKQEEFLKNNQKIEKEKEIDKLIEEENLKEKSKKFIEKSINKGHVVQGGTELDEVLPSVTRRGGAREAKKQSVLNKLKEIVKVFVGI